MNVATFAIVAGLAFFAAWVPWCVANGQWVELVPSSCAVIGGFAAGRRGRR